MNRKTKLLTLLLFIIPIYLIYNSIDRKIIYTTLGDHSYLYNYYDFISDRLRDKDKLKYLNNYNNEDYMINDIYNDIKHKNSLKKDLRESNLLTISIGKNDLIYLSNKYNLFITKKYIKKDLIKLINEIRKYYKKNIYILGMGNNIDNIYREVSSNYNKVYYIENNNDSINKYLNNSKVAQRIIKMLEK